MKPQSDPRSLLEAVPHEQRQLHTNVLALRENVKELTKNLIFRFATAASTPGSGNPYNISNTRAPITVVQHTFGQEFAVAKAMLQEIEESAEFQEAAALVDPLLAAVAALDAQEETERQEQARARAALNAALEIARKRAIENAENDPAVLAAKQKLRPVP